jgi:GNAT superfamily N-acetyltransferase
MGRVDTKVLARKAKGDPGMRIRPYQPGDEAAQVAIYNTAAAALPAFKPATVDEVERRYRNDAPDPLARYFAVVDGAVVGYAAFNPNGRISYPWCLPGAGDCRGPLLAAVMDAMRGRGLPEAWLAYRADWEPPLSFFQSEGFERRHDLVNYVAPVDRLTHAPVPDDRLIRPLERDDLRQFIELGRGIFTLDPATLDRFFWQNPFFPASSLFALAPTSNPSTVLGVGLLVDNAAYADPTKVDAAMPCFRLGALGTEGQRHKRIRGMFSSAFVDEAAGDILLAEAARRLERSGTTHLASQASSAGARLLDFLERRLDRQGSFPVLARTLA